MGATTSTAITSNAAKKLLDHVELALAKHTPIPSRYWTTVSGFELNTSPFSKAQAIEVAEALVANGYPRNTVKVLPEGPTMSSYIVLLKNHNCNGMPCESCAT